MAEVPSLRPPGENSCSDLFPLPVESDGDFDSLHKVPIETRSA